MFYLYVIGFEEDISTSNYINCYVGVTTDVSRRWKSHLKSKYTVGKFIQKHNWSFENNVMIIDSGSEDYCYEQEFIMRPLPFIGLNEAAGGHGGRIVEFTKERNDKVSKSLKGRKNSWGHKTSQTRRDLKVASGSNNPNAKQWTLTSPDNQKHFVDGNLEDFCEQHMLTLSTLTRNIGTVIPKMSSKFRNWGDELNSVKRNNTTGWKLEKGDSNYNP